MRLRRDADRAEGHGPEHRLCLQLSGGYLPTLDPPLSTQCSPTLSCVQMGKGRTTTGMIVACLVRDVLGGAVPSHKPMMADKTELPDEEEFLEEQHRWAGATDRGRYLDIFSNLSFTS